MMASACNWRDVYHALCKDIREERFERGAKLPTQSELSREYRASRHAVRRALQALSDDGTISCWQGREAVLVPCSVRYQIGPKTHLATCLRAQGHGVEIKTLHTGARRRLPAPVASMLKLTAGTRASFAEFMYYVDGIPTALGRHYFNALRLPSSLQGMDLSAPSAPKILSVNGVGDFTHASSFVEVRQPTSHEAVALNIPPSQSVLCILSQNIDQDGTPIEVTEAIARSDTVRLEIKPHQIPDLV